MLIPLAVKKIPWIIVDSELTDEEPELKDNENKELLQN